MLIPRLYYYGRRQDRYELGRRRDHATLGQVWSSFNGVTLLVRLLSGDYGFSVFLSPMMFLKTQLLEISFSLVAVCQASTHRTHDNNYIQSRSRTLSTIVTR
jgi:hypothetical protein